MLINGRSSGCIGGVARRHLYGVALGLTGLIAVAMVYLTRDSLPVIGLLWNPRILPWVYLMRYLLMMVGAVEVGGVVVNWVATVGARGRPASARSLIGGAVGLVVLVIFGFVFQMLPLAAGKIGDQYAHGVPIRSVARDADARSDGWPAYNFRGYEWPSRCTPSTTTSCRRWPTIGDDPERGCGRALWEIDNRDGAATASTARRWR